METQKIINLLNDSGNEKSGDTAKFATTDTKLHVPIVPLSTKDSANLAKQLNEGLKRSVYWNSYETKPEKVIEQGKNIYELLNASFQDVKRLYVLAYSIAEGVNDEAGIKSNKVFSFKRRNEKLQLIN